MKTTVTASLRHQLFSLGPAGMEGWRVWIDHELAQFQSKVTSRPTPKWDLQFLFLRMSAQLTEANIKFQQMEVHKKLPLIFHSKGVFVGFQPWNCQRCLPRQPVGLISFPPFVVQRNAPTGWCLGGILVAASHGFFRGMVVSQRPL